jgi:DNA polymerase IV (DinB-like DNA polymerase)
MRIIAHLDMDAFFASVEERDTPQWKGLPVVVGSDPQGGKGRGVVSTANYKAREYGIHSALPITKAWQFSQWAKQRGEPEAIFVEPDIEKYGKVSGEIVEIARSILSQTTEARPLENVENNTERIFDFKIEQASIDEMYLDLSFAGSYKKAAGICMKIKAEVKEKEKLTCSIGIGPNKLIAKIASDMKKPDGLTVVEEKSVLGFLENMPIRKIPGIGPKTETKFHGFGIVLIKDLRKLTEEELKERFGKCGEDMYYKSRGIDDSPVVEEHEIKSIGEQETFLKNTLDPNFIVDRLTAMCENVVRRLKADGFKSFQAVVVTVRFAGFETKNRSHTLKRPADSLDELKRETLKLLMPFFDKRENPGNKLIRLIGVRVEKLT